MTRLRLIFVALLAYLSVTKTIAAQSCTGQLPIACLAQGSGCKYDFINNVCMSSVPANDACQGYTTQATCSTNSCFWDFYLSHCVATMYSIQSVIPCPLWGSNQFLQADVYGTGVVSPACSYHGCVFTNQSICAVPSTAGNIAQLQNTASSTYSNQMYFINPTVIQNSLTAGVTLVSLINQNQNNPIWSVVTTLGQTGNLSTYYNVQNSSCSSYLNAASAGPVPFLALANYPMSAASIQANFNNFQFANDNSTGTYLQKTLGYASIGSNNLVKSVTTDGVYLYWQLQFDLTALVQNCNSRGVTVSSTPTGRTYFVPISLIDRSINGYYQSQQNYIITVPTTGTITISDTAVYKLRGYPLETTYQQSSCPAGSLKQFITWEYDVRDVFDPSKIVGPRSAADVFLTNPNTNALSNCYGDAVNSFNFLGCNSATTSCSYQIQTVTRCRVATPDGNAFNFCNYSSNVDRVADMGSNINYPTNLDSVHNLFINTYTCPSTGSQTNCALTNQNSANNADQVQAYIKDSSYATATTITQSPFLVQAGLLATPTSGITTLNVLSASNGTANATQFFDGNVFVGQPVTVVIFLPSSMQNTYDLRLNVQATNFTIYALDTLGNRITNAVVPSLDFTALQTSLLYSPKNTFDNNAICGPNGAFCAKLPSCSVLGSDGVSFSTAILKQMMPANGYQFVMSYRIGLPNANGQVANSRTLQSYNEGDDTSVDPTNNNNQQSDGQASFTVRLMTGSQTIDTPVEITFEKNFDDTMKSEHTHDAMYFIVIPLIGMLLLLVLGVHITVYCIMSRITGMTVLPMIKSVGKSVGKTVKTTYKKHKDKKRLKQLQDRELL